LQVLDESGPILKTSLAKVTEAIAIDNLTSIVAGLGNVKRSLNDILKDSQTLEEKVEQLKDGLANSQNNLGSALQECTSNAACASFLQEFNLQSDLALGTIIKFGCHDATLSVYF
jgi:hypothetical protein